MKRRPITLLIAALLLGGSAARPAGAAADLAIDASWVAQDCASGDACAEQALTLRLAGGDRLRWLISAGAVRALAPAGFVRTVAGAVPLDRGQVRRRTGGGGQGAGGAATGGRRGGEVATASSSGLAAASVEEEAWVSGADDLHMSLDARIAGGGSRLFAVEIEADVKAPVASEEKGLGTGEWDGRIGAGAERRFWSFTLFGGGGWSRIGDPVWAELNDVADGFAGVELEPVGPGLRWSAWVEAAGEIVEGAGPAGALAVSCRSEGASAWRATARAGLTGSSERLGFRLGYAWGAGARAGRRGGPGS